MTPRNRWVVGDCECQLLNSNQSTNRKNHLSFEPPTCLEKGPVFASWERPQRTKIGRAGANN